MNWQPIETYDAMKKKPKHAAFYFQKTETSRSGGFFLSPMIRVERYCGSRVCTHWCPLPDTDELDKG